MTQEVMKGVVKGLLRRTGFDLVRLPYPFTLAKDLRDVLTLRGVDCVFDVGANAGQFAAMLRGFGYTGLIISFEPNPALATVLGQRSTSDSRWRVMPYAPGEHDGTLTLHVPQDTKLASALPVSSFGRVAFGAVPFSAMRDETVAVRRLDTLFVDLQQQHGFRRPFPKMDTQGYDLQVLRGAEGCCSSMTGLLTEMSLEPLYDDMPDLAQSLMQVRKAGFDVTGLYPVAHDKRGALIEIDCLARRRE